MVSLLSNRRQFFSAALLRVVAVAFAIACGAATASAQTDGSEQAAFESAKELGTAAAYDAFLSNYPTGFYSDLARAYLAKLRGSTAGQVPPPAGAARFAGVTGFNLDLARHPGGVFIKNGPDSWIEQNAVGTSTFHFKEVGRTQREVQLFDGSRSVYLGLDVEEAIIWYSDSTQPRRPLYEIIEAHAGDFSQPQRNVPVAADPPRPTKPAKVTACEEGQRLVDGRCRRIRAREKPQGCPKGTVPVPETDDCRPIKREVLRCKRGYVKIDGKCIKSNDTAGYCGPGYRFNGSKCVPGAYKAPPKESPRPQWQLDAIKKGCKPGQGWNPQEGCHEND